MGATRYHEDPEDLPEVQKSLLEHTESAGSQKGEVVNGPVLRVPYSQQSSPDQTPLRRLLPVLRENTGDVKKLREAIASAFFKAKRDPMKLAGNSLIALKTYGVTDDVGRLTDFGKSLIALQGNEEEACRLLAKRLLIDLHGLGIVETLREMAQAHLSISLTTLPQELRQRGYDLNETSSDLSSIFGWLREAKVLNNRYAVNEGVYSDLLGVQAKALEALKGLTAQQIAFLHAMVALNILDWAPYNTIVRHAEELYAGEIRYNWKDVVLTVITPLVQAGFIEHRKASKIAKDTPEGRGGKTGDIKPTQKFESQVAEPVLKALYKTAGFATLREIRQKPLADIVRDIKKSPDVNIRGKALEILVIRLCQMLDLQFMGWREKDEKLSGGGEVDALMHSARLIYSRWQVQCKIGPITVDAIAKERGMSEVTLANVILVVGTEPATKSANTFRQKIIAKEAINIIYIDGPKLDEILKDNTRLVDILKEQAQDALRHKPTSGLKGMPPSDQEPLTGQGAIPPDPKPQRPQSSLRAPAYQTGFGRMFRGNSLKVLPELSDSGERVKLIVTSPPFALIKRKQYGNEDADQYVEWFEQFIPQFERILEPSGSLVIDIGGAWVKGLPVKSTYQFKLLLRLTERGFYLAQDFYHYNPAKLPTPAEWVTVRRLRVKDAVNNVFWLTRDPFVEADNRKVLTPYSDSMKGLLKNGYTPDLRPSGHNISDKFQRDNDGAIPPNLLQFANTVSSSHYLRRCEEEGIAPHPARFPGALPAFFIKLLTKPGELVLDPFAGSNVTGEVAESLKRRWISIELDSDYVKGSKFRFEPQGDSESEQPKRSKQLHLSMEPVEAN